MIKKYGLNVYRWDRKIRLDKAQVRSFECGMEETDL
jgi:hypothetical protein